MARPQKQTVDYFPHRCRPGKTMFILETRYNDKGYAFWFKLLELLGSAEGHAYYFNKEDNCEYLLAYTRTDKDQAIEILTLLANLEAIDKELWDNDKIIWSDNFVEGVKDAYRNRVIDIPIKPVSYVRNTPHAKFLTQSDVINPQTKEEKNKLYNTKENKIKEKNKDSCSNLSQNKLPSAEDMQEIATLYENNIGQITPLAAEELNRLMTTYNVNDIKDAIKEADLRQKRNLKYIAGILKNKNGQKPPLGDAVKYKTQKYGDMVQS